MEKKSHFRFLYLFFLFSVTLLFTNQLTAYSQVLRDPKEVQTGQITLEAFLKIHQKVIYNAIAESYGNDNPEVIILQVDYYHKQQGYNRDFLREADLSDTDLRKADLRYLNLKETLFNGSDLSKSDLRWTELQEATLADANLTNARILNCNLKEADLSGTILKNADLSNSNMKEANVTDTDFTGATLTGVDISEAEGLTVKQLLTTKNLSQTTLTPVHFNEVFKKNPALFKVP